MAKESEEFGLESRQGQETLLRIVQICPMNRPRSYTTDSVSPYPGMEKLRALS